jgi:hypothetical protein
LVLIISSALSFRNKNREQKFLEQPTFKPALLSESLKAVKDSTTLEHFLDVFKFSLYHLTKGEATEIFSFIDKNHKGIISNNDVLDFIEIFVKPFEACDSKKEAYIGQKDFKKCFENEPSSKIVQIPDDIKDKFHDTLIDLLTYNNFEKKTNFYSYLLLRKAMYSWSKCNSDAFNLSESSFRCAISFTIENGVIEKMPILSFYKLMTNDFYNGQMNFLAFVDAFTAINIFYLFGARRDIFSLDKHDFINAAFREDRVVHHFLMSDVENFYKIVSENQHETTQTMDFLSFYFFFNKYRLFNTVSKEKSTVPLTKIIKTIDHLSFPKRLRSAIDASFTNFKSDDYKPAMDTNQEQRPGEGKYYFSFKEKEPTKLGTSNKQTPTSDEPSNKQTPTSDEPSTNQDPRKIFFTIYCEEIPCKNINRLQFIKAFVYTDLYRRVSDNKPVTTVGEILKTLDNAYDLNIPKLSGDYRLGSKILRRLPNEIEIDLILFNSIFSLNSILSNTELLMNYDIHKLVNENYGMKELPSEIYQILNVKDDSQDKLNKIVNIFKAQGIASASKRHPPIKA